MSLRVDHVVEVADSPQGNRRDNALHYRMRGKRSPALASVPLYRQPRFSLGSLGRDGQAKERVRRKKRKAEVRLAVLHILQI